MRTMQRMETLSPSLQLLHSKSKHSTPSSSVLDSKIQMGIIIQMSRISVSRLSELHPHLLALQKSSSPPISQVSAQHTDTLPQTLDVYHSILRSSPRTSLTSKTILQVHSQQVILSHSQQENSRTTIPSCTSPEMAWIMISRSHISRSPTPTDQSVSALITATISQYERMQTDL